MPPSRHVPKLSQSLKCCVGCRRDRCIARALAPMPGASLNHATQGLRLSEYPRVEKHTQSGCGALRAKAGQELPLGLVADSDDSNPGRLPRGDAGGAVGEVTASSGRTPRRRQADRSKSGAGGDRRLLCPDHVGVDPHLDKAREPSPLEHRRRARAGRDHRALEPGMTGGLEIATRSCNCGHAPLAQPSIERLALPPGQTVGRIGAGGSLGSPSGRRIPRLPRKAWTPSSRGRPSMYAR